MPPSPSRKRGPMLNMPLSCCMLTMGREASHRRFREDDGQLEKRWRVALGYWVTGFGLFGSMPYFAIACSTTETATLPSSASDLSAATVT